MKVEKVYKPEEDETQEDEFQEEEQKEEQQKIVIHNEDEKLEKERVGVFLDKNILLSDISDGKQPLGMKIKIVELSTGKYGKNILFELVEDYRELEKGDERLMDLNKTNYNWLLEKLGDSVKKWKEQPVLLFGEAFQNTNKKGETIAGVKTYFEVA